MKKVVVEVRVRLTVYGLPEQQAGEFAEGCVQEAIEQYNTAGSFDGPDVVDWEVLSEEDVNASP